MNLYTAIIMIAAAIAILVVLAGVILIDHLYEQKRKTFIFETEAVCAGLAKVLDDYEKNLAKKHAPSVERRSE